MAQQRVDTNRASINADTTGNATGKPTRSGFVANASRIAQWRGADVWLRGYWALDWYDEALQIAEVDQQRAIVFLNGSTTYGIRENRRYVVINAPEELDSPGEYFIDRKRRILYFWPPAAIESMRIELTQVSEPLIRFNDSAFVEMNGIVIESTRGTAIRIEGGKSIEVKNCVVRNIGGHGIEIRNGSEHKIGESKLHHLGLSAITVSGGDRPRLVGAGHVVQGNTISEVGTRVSAGHPAIDVNGVGALIYENDIRSVPQIAIRFMGNDHRIESNTIAAACSESSDCEPSTRGGIGRRAATR